MVVDKVIIENVKSVTQLSVEFTFPESKLLVITGKNGVGKTTVINAFNLLSDPSSFTKSSGESSVTLGSLVTIVLNECDPVVFYYNDDLGSMDSNDSTPLTNTIVAELPIPYGKRFSHFSTIAMHDSELKFNIAADDYKKATDLITFLSDVYSNNRFGNLKSTKIKRNVFYFVLKENDYYIREDHFSSGEFFLIQLYRLITSGAKLVLIDELDVALDAVAQVNLYKAICKVIIQYESRVIVVSHSLAFMNTVSEGEIYYLEENSGIVSLQPRSFGYVKSDLFGFRGYDRYILTEDPTLEAFIEYLIKNFSIASYYRHLTIAMNGVNQLVSILHNNDKSEIFSTAKNVMCLVDGDVFSILRKDYQGKSTIMRSPVNDIEVYIYSNRSTFFPQIEPTIPEAKTVKRAAKTYWRLLVENMGIKETALFQIIIDNNRKDADILSSLLSSFLQR